jgi:predicted GNAT family acetyltransferase
MLETMKRIHPEIVHNAAHQRFEAIVDGMLCRSDYRMSGGAMMLVHTEVPPGLQGRGIAAALVRATLEYAREHGHKVVPACSYVRTYMRRHPDTAGLLA